MTLKYGGQSRRRTTRNRHKYQRGIFGTAASAADVVTRLAGKHYAARFGTGYNFKPGSSPAPAPPPRGGNRTKIRKVRKSAVIGDKPKEINIHGGEHVEQRQVVGRRMPRLTLTNKMAQCSAEVNIDRLQGITYPRSDIGFFKLDRHMYQTSAPKDTENLPLYLFELGQFNQNIAAANQRAIWRLKVINTPGNAPTSRYYSFNFPGSQSVGGTVGNGTYFLEDSNTNYKHRKALFEWSDIRMELICPSAVPTTFHIDIVQFLSDQLLPDYDQGVVQPPTDTGVSPGTTFKERQYFYDNLVNKLVNGPLWVNNTALNMRKYMRVLYHKTIKADAQSFNRTTGSLSTLSGQERVFKLFKWFNRIMHYDRTSGQSLPPIVPNANADTQNELPLSVQQIIGAQLSATELGKRRIFLMIRAENSYASDVLADATKPGICPSFDILIRNKLVTSEDTRQ